MHTFNAQSPQVGSLNTDEMTEKNVAPTHVSD